MKIKGLICFFILLHGVKLWSGEPYFYRSNDTLVIGNASIEAKYLWNKGNIKLLGLRHKEGDHRIQFSKLGYGLSLNGEQDNQELEGIEVIERSLDKVSIQTEFVKGQLLIKQITSIAKGSKAIRHQYFLKGKAQSSTWISKQPKGLDMIESNTLDIDSLSAMFRLGFDTAKFRIMAIRFREATDYHDNPVHKSNVVPFRVPDAVRSNILEIRHKTDDLGLFILKESPIGYSQQAYPGFDFLVDEDGISMHGIGLEPKDLHDAWIPTYSYAVGISENNDWGFRCALIDYQKTINPYVSARDFMIMANTWGDRSKDSRMNASFILSELERAKQLGITHLQLDDGWQQGLSKNSATRAGLRWDDWDKADWEPHKERFPGGLAPLANQAKKWGITLGIWFNPSKKGSYENWNRDSEIVLNLHRKYGFSVFKIDGMQLEDKESERNLARFFSKVKKESNGQITFNMDVTAGKRMGFHFFQEYGNVFLENRYTDWGNYFPYRTLRNLWNLASYMPAERLQIEFLNVNRNDANYIGSNGAPSSVGQRYAFGVTLMAQPLAWMELTGLESGQVEDLAPLIEQYSKLGPSLHQGTILPVGEEPSGYAWSGFLSYSETETHYLIVYRENSEQATYEFQLPFRCEAVGYELGDIPVNMETNGNGIKITFERPWQFALLKLSTRP